MSVRTITVTEEAYRKLRAHKGVDESFSEVVIRLTTGPPLSTFAGTLPHATAHALREAVRKDREVRRGLDLTHVARH